MTDLPNINPPETVEQHEVQSLKITPQSSIAAPIATEEKNSEQSPAKKVQKDKEEAK